MKKLLLLLIPYALPLMPIYAQNDPWNSVMGNGFGNTNNVTIFALDGFNGTLYAGTQLKKPSATPAEIWESTTGNSGTFAQIPTTAFSPTLLPSDVVITGMSHTNLSPGYIYLSTTNVKAGAVVYSSTNGTSWNKISKRGMGTAKNYDFAPDYVVYNPGKGVVADSNFLYVAVRDTSSGGAASVWRTLYNDQDSTHWKKVLDFNSFSPIIQQTTWLYVWGDTLYVAGQDQSRISHLYQSSDGINWKENAGAKNGFGVSTNQHIASMAAYKNVLYATTMDPTTGAQVWKTSNGNTWTQVTGNAFGNGQGITEMRRALVTNGMLWVSGQWFNGGSSVADLVWHTSDGIKWIQSDKPGFGVTTNVAGFPSLASFNQAVYQGTYNLTTGAQLWRTYIGIPVGGFTTSNTNPCIGDIVAFTDTSTVTTSYTWLINGTPFDTTINASHIFSSAGTYTVTLVAHNDSLTDTAKQVIVVKSCVTGNSQLSTFNSQFSIYPNPSNGTIYINGIAAFEKQVNIEILDITGRTVLKQNLSVKNQTAQLKTDLPGGIYIISIKGTRGENILQKRIGIIR